MKKLLFVLALIFIGQQAFSQMYIVAINTHNQNYHPFSCPSGSNVLMTTVDPQGNASYECLYEDDNTEVSATNLIKINANFNYIIGQGYKLVGADGSNELSAGTDAPQGTWYFAIP